jgi:hypothetical protein
VTYTAPPLILGRSEAPQGRSMAGRWLGFNKEFKVNTGDWSLEWIRD